MRIDRGTNKQSDTTRTTDWRGRRTVQLKLSFWHIRYRRRESHNVYDQAVASHIRQSGTIIRITPPVLGTMLCTPLCTAELVERLPFCISHLPLHHSVQSRPAGFGIPSGVQSVVGNILPTTTLYCTILYYAPIATQPTPPITTVL